MMLGIMPRKTPIQNPEIQRILEKNRTNKDVADLVAEIVRLRNALLDDRRACATIAGRHSLEASAAIRDHAQEAELEYSGYVHTG